MLTIVRTVVNVLKTVLGIEGRVARLDVELNTCEMIVVTIVVGVGVIVTSDVVVVAMVVEEAGLLKLVVL